MKQKKAYNYFKEGEGFTRFFWKLKEKYASLGHLPRQLILENSNEEEAQRLSLFLGKNYHSNMDIKISIIEFNKKLNAYFDCTLEDVLALYFNRIVTKKEKRQTLEDSRVKYFQDILIDYKDTPANSWLKSVLQLKNGAYSKIIMKYNDDKKKLYLELNYIMKAINNLPYLYKEVKPLNVFAALITNNPHFFDLDTSMSNLLIDALSYLFNCNIETREDKIELLKKAGIMIDEISNFIITYGISSNISGLKSFNESKLPTMLSLLHIEKMDDFKAHNNSVFILENPILLSVILSYNFPCSIIITSGNPNLVLYKLLDKLQDKKITMYYNGDIDPEGLLIASKLKNRYPDLILFGYEVGNYLNNKSNIMINESRIKKLDLVSILQLQGIVSALKKSKYPFYQENNIEYIINYIKES